MVSKCLSFSHAILIVVTCGSYTNERSCSRNQGSWHSMGRSWVWLGPMVPACSIQYCLDILVEWNESLLDRIRGSYTIFTEKKAYHVFVSNIPRQVLRKEHRPASERQCKALEAPRADLCEWREHEGEGETGDRNLQPNGREFQGTGKHEAGVPQQQH